MRLRLLALLLFAALLVAASPPAEARGRVSWTQVDVRKGDDAKRVGSNLKKLLEKKSRRAKWGKGAKLELRARVTKLSWEERDDVLRVSVTVVAKIVGGKTARSYIRMGGHPKERRKIEKQALDIVSSGLVTRLAAIAKASEPKDEDED